MPWIRRRRKRKKEIIKKSDYALWLPQHVFVWQLVETCLKEEAQQPEEEKKNVLKWKRKPFITVIDACESVCALSMA